MNVSKIFHALQALDTIANLDELSLVDSNSWSRHQRSHCKTIGGITKQALKMAVALSDTSFATLNRSLQYREEYRASGKDLSAFYEMVAGKQANPINNGIALLRGLK